MSYVDLLSGVRWPEPDHIQAVEADLRSKVTHVREHVMIRRMWQLLLPLASAGLPPPPADGSPDPHAATRAFLAGALPYCSPLTPAQAQEMGAAGAAFAQADALAEQGRADAALLHAALDHLEARQKLQALPAAAPVDGSEDPLSAEERAVVEAQRTALQAQLDAAAPATLDLVAQYDARATPPAEEPPPEPEP